MAAPTRRGTALACAALAVLAVGAPAGGQQLAVETSFRGFDFDEALGTEAAQLLLVPVALRLPLGSRLRADVYAAWARGEVERGGETFRLEGAVDTRVKLSLQAAPWAVVSAAVNVPTGNETHDPAEALVAAVLSSDLLGFRESSWGTGLAVTTGLATAARVGGWGVGVGASYRLADGFEPTTEQDLEYQPGDEVRVRVGLDRNVGRSGKLNLGATWQNFQEDQAAGRNLFQPGQRIMVDMSWAFRAGAQTWTLYAADLWRENGDLFQQLQDTQGNIVGDSVIATPSQNLVVAGLTGSIPLSTSVRLRPSADLRWQDREVEEGSGWIAGVGGDIPFGLGGTDVFPKARFFWGKVADAGGEHRDITGASFGITLRWGG